MKQTLSILTLALASSLALAHGEAKHEPAAVTVKEQQAWGIAGDPKRASRSIEIRMTDAMRFTPDAIRVKRGETVRFVLKNDGGMLHEMVIGTHAVLAEHAALMRKFPDMEHDEPWIAHVAPGATGEIVWHFNRAGTFDFACLIPGHFEAGMKGRITVRP
ncbi:MAG: cupredoxin family protein [Stenotrophomonas sp.]|uniref:cupredoxin domain-containing protein n=1 Tax=Stenotrophomonas sp. TaxID=69392 RepID=UPI0019C7AA75|nr:cupredoxin family protein [Stenotrophomonas sp.]MBD3743300.1 cupredoxin family protein [Stenotrophomonas sp.]